MSFFSPITERSPAVRFLFTSIYGILILGALTMLIPFMVTLSGSTAGSYDLKTFSLYPKFLFHEKALWERYVDAKYTGSIETYKTASNDIYSDFGDVKIPVEPSAESLKLWEEFRKEYPTLEGRDADLGFTRTSKKEAAYENRKFRVWLLEQHGGDLIALNKALATQFGQVTNILPPPQRRIFAPDLQGAFADKFEEYRNSVPESHRTYLNIGNFFRAVYLPRAYGGENDDGTHAYNAAYGTNYASLADIPFPSTKPALGGEAWADFIQKILNPVFVELSPEGEAELKESGLERNDFIRIKANPDHFKVVSLDTKFHDWAKKTHNVEDARIPQIWLDWLSFQKEKGFWRMQFLKQNFVFVLDEVMIQGNGVKNSLIYILLAVGGALTINPLAAYALSRYKLPQSYHILLFFLATIAFPVEVSMIPNFLQLKELGLLNTFGALILPGLVNGFSIFLLKGFFDSLPKELYEAADIDGANEWQIFWGITMNLSKPILAVIALGAFTSAYGAFFFALILAPDQKMWTLMVWVYQLRQEAGPGIVYASLLITAVPTLIVYLCAQNVILRGIVVPSDK